MRLPPVDRVSTRSEVNSERAILRLGLQAWHRATHLVTSLHEHHRLARRMARSRSVAARSIDTARSQLSACDPIAAVATLRAGLELWRGSAYGEFAHEDWAHAEAMRLNELKTVAQEELNDGLLACGLASDVVSATRGLVAEQPLRERLRAQHMLALYRAGRQAEALRSLDDFQEALIEVGLEPPRSFVRSAGASPHTIPPCGSTHRPGKGQTRELQGGEAVTNLGFARGGSMLVITGADGTVRLYDLERDAPAGLVWDGTGSVFSSPSWYDPETDSVWVATSGLLMEVPLDPQRWVEQACDLVGRDLTEVEWERWIPGDDPPQTACS